MVTKDEKVGKWCEIMGTLLCDLIDERLNKKYEETGENTYLKVIVTGHVLEVYEYEKLPVLPSQKKKEKETELDFLDFNDNVSFDNTLTDRQNNMQKARNRLRRLITANFDENSKFITLTFKDNLTDVKKANKEFKKFIQRMRYRYGGFKYVAVIEFQKRGAVHYHMMSDLDYIENEKLNKIWGNGFVKINNITHVDNVGAYMIKYMTKDNNDMRLRGLKSYQTSKNLDRPIEYIGDEAEKILNLYGLENKKTVFSSCYENEHLGLTTYKEFNLKRL